MYDRKVLFEELHVNDCEVLFVELHVYDHKA